MKNILSCSFFVPFLLLSLSISANNLTFSSIRLESEDNILITMSWENAWNLPANTAPANHDAVWIFIKYRIAGEVSWQTARISTDHQAHQVLSGSVQLEAVSDEMGIFIVPVTTGNIHNVEILLYLSDKLPSIDKLQIKVFGIEMVYIPEGAFALGDGISKHSLIEAVSEKPFVISSESEIASGATEGKLYALDDYFPAGDIPATYPKGYSAFYAMKYEITQQQFVDFLNCLSFEQQRRHVLIPPDAAAGTFPLGFGDSFRNGIIIARPGSPGMPAVFGCDANGDGLVGGTQDGQHRACNYLNHENILAYLAWSGLRPLTELELEKMARGPEAPLPRGYAWNTTMSVNANSPEEDGSPFEKVSETATATAGLANHGAEITSPFLQGPLRVGFAATESSDRIEAGASYYGIMDLSGNVWEFCVSLTEKALLFDGSHGNGKLDQDGLPDAMNWPLQNNAYGQRGGGWNSWVRDDLEYQFRDLAISDRFYAHLPFVRRNTSGGRGGRSVDK
ncbi:MAG: SUMF1/EgtB/PvdO family nonheme iron enzyme [Cyclobacteriaceae bacterium]|nr:SUMF1/EgtB/PvdO family nonheme iron enzyme [Cyclobacteriaceae bacterium]